MTKPNELIETIEKALEASTPGPWRSVTHLTTEGWEVRSETGKWITGWGSVLQTIGDAHLIANAPEWLRALLEENKRLNKRLETMAEKAAESFEKAVESAMELEQVKAERDKYRHALEDVSYYQHRWSDSPITEVQKIAKESLQSYPPREKGAEQ